MFSWERPSLKTGLDMGVVAEVLAEEVMVGTADGDALVDKSCDGILGGV